MIILPARFVQSSAVIATLLLGLLKILLKFCALALDTLSKIVARNAKTATQIAGIGVICFGIWLIYPPAAYIFGGLITVTALEVRS